MAWWCINLKHKLIKNVYSPFINIFLHVNYPFRYKQQVEFTPKGRTWAIWDNKYVHKIDFSIRSLCNLIILVTHTVLFKYRHWQLHGNYNISFLLSPSMFAITMMVFLTGRVPLIALARLRVAYRPYPYLYLSFVFLNTGVLLLVFIYQSTCRGSLLPELKAFFFGLIIMLTIK